MNEVKNLTTKQKQDVQSLVNQEVERVNWMIGVVVIVLLMGFATMFATVWGLVLDATRFKTETYQDLVNKVQEQNIKVDTLSKDIGDLAEFVTTSTSTTQ